MDFTGDDGAPAAHHRRDRRARSRPRARRRAAARAHAAEGEERPPRAAARDPRQPRPDLGALAGHRALDPAGAGPCRLPDAPFATATDEDGFHHSLWRITRPGAHRGDPRRGRRRPPRARRRPPPLRDRHHLPRRAARRRRRRSRRRRDHDPGGGARPRAALRARDPPPARPASAGSTCAPRWPARSGSTRPAPNVPEGVAALEVAMRESGGLGLVDRDGLALLLPAAELEAAHGRPPGGAARRRLGALRRRGAPRRARGVARLPQRRGRGRRAGREGRRRRRGAACDRSPSTRSAPPAAADLRMPEKTTFFAPKPRTGMVFRSLD